jgi:hypothetical protein
MKVSQIIGTGAAMLSEVEIQSLAKEIAQFLSTEESVELLHPRSEVEAKVASILLENMEEERKLNADCDKILDQVAREIDRGSVDPHKMFLMIKKKIAKERKFIL